jgi:hypothetical protein
VFFLPKVSSPIHIVLKFQNEEIGESDTIQEHSRIAENGRLVWGQGSKGDRSGLSEGSRTMLKQQIASSQNTYVFFTTQNKGNRELFVGLLHDLYDRGDIQKGSQLTKFIPPYYANKVGTQDDINCLFVDVSNFIRIDHKLYDEMTLNSNGKKLCEVKNSSSIFMVNISDDTNNLLKKIMDDGEYAFQKLVESLDNVESIVVEDVPKKPKSRSERAKHSGAYDRNAEVSRNAVVLAKHCCELDPEHKEFTSRTTGKNYVESHHLVPMEFQDEFPDVSIDVEANVVALCSCCHTKIHHAINEEIIPLVEKMYWARKNRLEKCGINITLVSLLEMYCGKMHVASKKHA